MSLKSLKKKKAPIWPPARTPWAEVLTQPAVKIKSSHQSLGWRRYAQPPPPLALFMKRSKEKKNFFLDLQICEIKSEMKLLRHRSWKRAGGGGGRSLSPARCRPRGGAKRAASPILRRPGPVPRSPRRCRAPEGRRKVATLSGSERPRSQGVFPNTCTVPVPRARPVSE